MLPDGESGFGKVVESPVSRRRAPGRAAEGEEAPYELKSLCEIDVLRPPGPVEGVPSFVVEVGGFKGELTEVEKVWYSLVTV